MRFGSQISPLHPVSKATLFVKYVGCLASTTGHCMQKSSGTDNSEINFQREHSLQTWQVSLYCSRLILFIHKDYKRTNNKNTILTLILWRSRTGTVWFYTCRPSAGNIVGGALHHKL